MIEIFEKNIKNSSPTLGEVEMGWDKGRKHRSFYNSGSIMFVLGGLLVYRFSFTIICVTCFYQL